MTKAHMDTDGGTNLRPLDFGLCTALRQTQDWDDWQIVIEWQCSIEELAIDDKDGLNILNHHYLLSE